MPTTTESLAPILTERAAARALERHLLSVATGERVRWMREQAGITQAELAAFAGMSETTLRRVEAGERALRPAERAAVARGLGIGLAVMTATRPRVVRHPVLSEPELSEGSPEGVK